MSSKKTTDLINIKFEVLEEGISWTYSDHDDLFDLDEEWKKKLNND